MPASPALPSAASRSRHLQKVVVLSSCSAQNSRTLWPARQYSSSNARFCTAVHWRRAFFSWLAAALPAIVLLLLVHHYSLAEPPLSSGRSALGHVISERISLHTTRVRELFRRGHVQESVPLHAPPGRHSSNRKQAPRSRSPHPAPALRLTPLPPRSAPTASSSPAVAFGCLICEAKAPLLEHVSNRVPRPTDRDQAAACRCRSNDCR